MRLPKILWVLPLLLLSSCSDTKEESTSQSNNESAESTIESANTATSDNPQNQAETVLGDVQFKVCLAE